MALSTAAEPVPFVIDEHGVARVGGSRVTLAVVIETYKQGCSVEELADEFPGAQASDIRACVTYYLRHKATIEAYLTQDRARAAETHERVMKALPYSEDFERRLTQAKAMRNDARPPR